MKVNSVEFVPFNFVEVHKFAGSRVVTTGKKGNVVVKMEKVPEGEGGEREREGGKGLNDRIIEGRGERRGERERDGRRVIAG